MRYAVLYLAVLSLLAPSVLAFSLDVQEAPAADFSPEIAAKTGKCLQNAHDSLDETASELGAAVSNRILEPVEERAGIEANQSGENADGCDSQDSQTEQEPEDSTAREEEEKQEEQSENGQENEEPAEPLPVSGIAGFVSTAVEEVIGTAEKVVVFVGNTAKNLLSATGIFEKPVEQKSYAANAQAEIPPVIAGVSLLAIIGTALGTIYAIMSKFAIAPLYGVVQHGEISNENRKRVYEII
ncbi:MAG: hypothetical protein PHH26_09130, partial [Candidatus Thermoplasmatota archaeon]|nr:hypothetical protein [Candidatus Thermoplasmatota archaeon]